MLRFVPLQTILGDHTPSILWQVRQGSGGEGRVAAKRRSRCWERSVKLSDMGPSCGLSAFLRSLKKSSKLDVVRTVPDILKRRFKAISKTQFLQRVASATKDAMKR